MTGSRSRKSGALTCTVQIIIISPIQGLLHVHVPVAGVEVQFISPMNDLRKLKLIFTYIHVCTLKGWQYLLKAFIRHSLPDH